MPICLYPAPLAVDERKGDQRLSLFELHKHIAGSALNFLVYT
jgi:hypothetical protein